MKLANRTPFAPLTFQSLDLAGDPFQVVVLKATFDIIPGAQPVLASRPSPVLVSADYCDADEGKRMRSDDDIAPFKPRTDILVTATSYPPRDGPSNEWLAGISIGKLQKRILVTGPRSWTHSTRGGWTLEPPQSTDSVALRYEHAFGGVVRRNNLEDPYPENPIGCGFVDVDNIDTSLPVVAPTILTPDAPLPALGERYPVEGLSAIHRAWQPRLSKAGTYDEVWAKTRHPNLPEDFDFAFYNCAHPDLIYSGYLTGGEEVRLERLCRDHEVLLFRLPSQVVGVALTDKAGYRYGGPARLDTVHIDTERLKLFLVFRATFPLLGDGVALIEAVATDSVEAKVRSGGLTAGETH